MFGYIASDDTVYCCAVGRSIVGSRKSEYSSFMYVDRRQQIWSNSIESWWRELTSGPAQYLQSHNPLHRVVLTGGPPLHSSMSLGVSEPSIHSSRKPTRSWSRTRRKIASTQFETPSTSMWRCQLCDGVSLLWLLAGDQA